MAAQMKGKGGFYLFSVFPISSIGFGAGVVAIVQPIHAPIAKMATKAIETGAAISQKRTSAATPMFRNDAMYGS